MKSELINFELWFTYSDETDKDTLDRLTIELALNDIKNSVENDQIDCVIGLLLVDGFLCRNNDRFYSVLREIQNGSYRLGIKKLYLLVGICSDYQEELDKRDLNYTIISWNFCVNQMYQSYKDKFHLLPNWSTVSNKMLFLGGVPSRPNRIGLMNRFYKSNLLDNMEWSFFPPWTLDDKKWCRQHLKEYTDIEYDKFLKECDRAVDEKYTVSKDYSRVTGKGLADNNLLNSPWLEDCCWIDPTVYKNTSLSIISEGGAYGDKNYKFLTQILWRAIINRHPFIIADIPDRYHFIKECGLRTFEDYLELTNYGYINSEESQLDAVVVNAKYFLENMHKNTDDIKKDIEHNYNIFFKIVEENNRKKIWLERHLNVSKNSIEKWFLSKDFKTFIRIPKI